MTTSHMSATAGMSVISKARLLTHDGPARTFVPFALQEHLAHLETCARPAYRLYLRVRQRRWDYAGRSSSLTPSPRRRAARASAMRWRNSGSCSRR